MSFSKIHPLGPDFRVDVGDPWMPPPSIRPRVEEIWALESAQRGKDLTDGLIYTLTEFSSGNLLIQPTEYRHVIARRRDPGLKAEGLVIRPLAVTGILLTPDGLVLGRRGSIVVDDVGLWEPAPAGGLSMPDPTLQILDELEEEVGISRSEISSVEPCGLVEDMASGVIDIVFRLKTHATGHQVIATHAAHGNREYAELAIVKLSEIAAFLQDHRRDLLPALRQLLRVASIL